MREKIFKIMRKKELAYIKKYIAMNGIEPSGTLLGRVMNYSPQVGCKVMNYYYSFKKND